MSVDIAWDTITSGPDGDALGEKIRAFVHSKFQQITLPRFINSVQVHSFEFGTTCPEVEIKDISDPLPDFYEDDESNDGGSQHSQDDNDDDLNFTNSPLRSPAASEMTWEVPRHHGHIVSPIQEVDNKSVNLPKSQPMPRAGPPVSSIDTHSFPRSSTPGIPGGTSNLSYFHLPVGGLSGAQTPLAAVASGTPFAPGPWQNELQNRGRMNLSRDLSSHDLYRPRTSDSIPSPEIGSPYDPSSPESRPVAFPAAEKVSDDLTLENEQSPTSSAVKEYPTNPSDLQVIAHVKYDGDVRMTLTAQILLDYPMPSFVNIPLKLSVTGMKFDGVAVLAMIKKRMHFAFLDPEDALMLSGDLSNVETPTEGRRNSDQSSSFGTLLREVRIESEIGQQTSGKQVLKNVSKVEKFVLEQVKRIFEEEFVFPSFWTFLI